MQVTWGDAGPAQTQPFSAQWLCKTSLVPKAARFVMHTEVRPAAASYFEDDGNRCYATGGCAVSWPMGLVMGQTLAERQAKSLRVTKLVHYKLMF